MRNLMRFLFAAAILLNFVYPVHAQFLSVCKTSEDIPKAIEACTKIIDAPKVSRDDLVVALRQRASNRANWGEKDGAMEDINRAIELVQTDASLYAVRASTREEYDSGNAVEDMDKAIELAPKNAGYRVQRAKLQVFNSNYYNTDEDFAEAIKLEPKKWEWYFARYEYLVSRHEYEKALADVSQVVSLGKSEMLIWRGQVLMHLGRFDEALTDLTKFTDSIAGKEKENLPAVLAYGMRGYCHMTLNKPEKAVADYSKAINIFDDGTLRQLRGNAFVGMKQYEIAIQDYTYILKKTPDNVAILYLRSVAYDLNGQPKLALADRTDAAFYSSGLKKPKKD